MTNDIIETDALIVGAGPCGLFQVFELGLLGIKAHIVDTMRHAGGQCTELYPDKPLYDLPGIPACSGGGAVHRTQLEVRLGEEVTVVAPRDDDGFDVETDVGTRFHARTIFIAGGVGSFQPRRMRLEGIEAHEEKSLFYRVRDPQSFAGRRVAILGGGDSALDWTLALAPIVESLTIIHRRTEYRGAPATVAQMKSLVAAGEIGEITGKVSAYTADADGITGITVDTADGPVEVACDTLLVFWGLAPKLGPIAEWGLDINRKTINVDTEKFETNIPGIYAIGDINYYPGKKKLILSGFHEAALAAFAAKERLEPGRKAHLQYTTTSPLMHKRLGVAADD